MLKIKNINSLIDIEYKFVRLGYIRNLLYS